RPGSNTYRRRGQRGSNSNRGRHNHNAHHQNGSYKRTTHQQSGGGGYRGDSSRRQRGRHGQSRVVLSTALVGHSDASAPAMASPNTSGSIMPEIPGFYYDVERRRYFRIVNQGAAGPLPSSYETIRKKQRLEEQLNQLKIEQKQYGAEWRRNYNVHSMLKRRELNARPLSYRHYAAAATIGIKSFGLTDENVTHSDITDMQIADHGGFMLLGTKEGSLELRRLSVDRQNQPVLAHSSSSSITMTSQITSISLRKDNYFVWPGTAVIHRIDVDHDQHYISTGTNHPIINSSLWCSDIADSVVALGGSKIIGIISPDGIVNTRISVSSDVFAITSYKASTISGLKHSSAVCSLLPLNDWHLISSAMNGSIRLWDMRFAAVKSRSTDSYSKRAMAAPLLEFAGHVNEYTQRLGIALDSTGVVLSAAGQDKNIRCWSTMTGEQLRRPLDPLPQVVPTIQWYGPLCPGRTHLASIEQQSAMRPSLWAASANSLYYGTAFDV
ncbi:hypothetical protein BDF19DRAFT_450441, partial [Syncephalis fuscata]